MVHPGANVGRTPWSAADPLVGSGTGRDEGVPRGPGGPPYAAFDRIVLVKPELAAILTESQTEMQKPAQG